MKKRLQSVKPRQSNERHKAHRRGHYASGTVEETFDIIEDADESEESELITTVKCQEPRPLSEEASMTFKKRRAQDLKKLSIRLHEAIANKEINGLPGYTANRIFIDAKNRVMLKALPVYYKAVFTNVRILCIRQTYFRH